MIMASLDKELETYKAHLDVLLSDEGKFTLIQGEAVAGIFDTYGDALKQGYEQFGVDTPFLVKRIARTGQDVLFISRHVSPCLL
jgi:hypothetical protein